MTTDGPPLSRHVAVRDALGTTYRITLYAPDAATADEAVAAAFARLDGLDAALNVARPDGEIARLNAARDFAAVPVGDDLFAVLQRALRLAGATRGAIDVTSGPYHELWRRTAAEGRIPSPAELEDTRLRVGWEKLRLDSIERSATLTVAGMQIEPAGIVVGYAADEVFRELRRHGCDRARVDAGNVVVAGTPPPGQAGWTVSLRGMAGRGEPTSLSVTDAAIAFSANVPIPGKAESRAATPRILHPVSGRLLKGGVPVVVLARSGASAESVAAAAFVLGPSGADSLAAAEGGARIRFVGGPTPADRAKQKQGL